MERKFFQKLHFGQKEKPFTLKQEKSTRKVDWNQKKSKHSWIGFDDKNVAFVHIPFFWVVFSTSDCCSEDEI